MNSKVCLLALLVCYSMAHAHSQVIIKSDLVGEKLSDGDPLVEGTTPHEVNFPISGAKYIWGPNWHSSRKGEVREVIEYFKVSNPNSYYTIYASADDEF